MASLTLQLTFPFKKKITGIIYFSVHFAQFI